MSADSRGRDAQPANFADAGEHLTMVLHSLGAAERYNRWIVDTFAAYLGREVLEVGAGEGNLTALLAEGDRRVVASEPYAPFTHSIAERFEGNSRVVALDLGIDASTAPRLASHASGNAGYDSTILVNVLEHIDNDVEALTQLRGLVRPGGYVLLFVPAFQLLYSEFDRRVGHYRRYRKRDLSDRCAQAGLEVVNVRYMNLPGWFAWLLVARILGKVPTDPSNVRRYERWVLPWLRPLEARIPPPFGQSLVMVARRPLR